MSNTYPPNKLLCAWFSVTGAVNYSDLSRTLIYEHINDGSLVSSTVKRPGCKRGRRLVQRASLDQLIESGIGQKSVDNTGKNAAQESSEGHGDVR